LAKTLRVDLLGDATQLNRTLDEAKAKAEGTGKGFLSMGKTAALAGGAAGVGLLFEGLKDSIDAGMNAEKVNARLAVVFKDVGLSAKQYGGQVEDLTSKGRRLGFMNEDVKTSFGSLLLATGNVKDAITQVGIAEDLARYKSVDLGTATKALTMAHAGSTRMLKQLGISITPVTTAYDALKASGEKLTTAQGMLDAAHAKAIDRLATYHLALKLVTGDVQGQAQAYAGTASGAMAQFRAQLNNVFEVIGLKLLPTLTKLLNWVMQEMPTIEKVASVVFTAVKYVIDGVKAPMQAVIDLLQGNFSGAWNAIKAPIQDVIDLVSGPLTGAWNAISSLASSVWSSVSGAVTGAFTDIKSSFSTAWQTVNDGLTSAWGALSSLATKVWDGIKTAVTSVFKAIKTYYVTQWEVVKTGLTAAWNALSSLATKVWDAIKKVVTGAFTAIKSAYSTAWQTVKTGLTSAWNTLSTLATKVWGAIKTAATGAFKAIQTAFNSVWKPVYSGFETALKWIGNQGKAVWSAVSGAVKTAMNAISTAINAAMGPINAIIGALKTLIGWAQSALGAIQNLITGSKSAPVPPTSPATTGGRGSHGGGYIRHTGGLIPKLHFGGAADDVFAILQRGEYVLQRSAVNMLGTAMLDDLNKIGESSGPVSIQGANVAGRMGGGTGAPMQVNLHLDGRMIATALVDPMARQTNLMIRRNGG